MNTIETKISEIKNLNLIYIYAIDSAFKDGTNKYVGAKIIYSKNKMFELDYRNPYFEKLLLHIKKIDTEEKDDHIIALLGDYSKLLIESNYFNLENENSINQNCITYSSSNNIYIYKYRDLIFELIKSILKFYKKYEQLSIDDIRGYNYNWGINYNIGCKKKILPMIIYLDEFNNIELKLSYLDNLPVNIEAKIVLNEETPYLSWSNIIDGVHGKVEFNFDTKEIINTIENDDGVIEKNNQINEITFDEYNQIKIYEKLLNIYNSEYIKIGFNTYLSSEAKKEILDSDQTLYDLSITMFNITPKQTFYEKRKKIEIKKYKNELSITLDEGPEGANFLLVENNDNSYILLEKYLTKSSKTLFKYSIMYNPKKLRLNNIEEEMTIEPLKDKMDSLEDIKIFVKRKSDKNGHI